MIPFADNFLAGAILTLVLPAAVLIAVAIWYTLTVRRMAPDLPGEDPQPAPQPAAAQEPERPGGSP